MLIFCVTFLRGFRVFLFCEYVNGPVLKWAYKLDHFHYNVISMRKVFLNSKREKKQMTRNMVGRARRLWTELAFKPKRIIGEEILKHNALTDFIFFPMLWLIGIKWKRLNGSKTGNYDNRISVSYSKQPRTVRNLCPCLARDFACAKALKGQASLSLLFGLA